MPSFRSYSSNINIVTETWLNSDVCDSSVKLTGYDRFRHDRALGRGGGTCIIVESSYDTSLATGFEINFNGNQTLLVVVMGSPSSGILAELVISKLERTTVESFGRDTLMTPSS